MTTYGPPECRVRWEYDDMPYDPGDTDHCEAHSEYTRGCEVCERYSREVWDYVDRFGVYGCIVELRAPACAYCGHKEWEVADSLWGIVGDGDYHREVERELVAEASCLS